MQDGGLTREERKPKRKDQIHFSFRLQARGREKEGKEAGMCLTETKKDDRFTGLLCTSFVVPLKKTQHFLALTNGIMEKKTQDTQSQIITAVCNHSYERQMCPQRGVCFSLQNAYVG